MPESVCPANDTTSIDSTGQQELADDWTTPLPPHYTSSLVGANVPAANGIVHRAEHSAAVVMRVPTQGGIGRVSLAVQLYSGEGLRGGGGGVENSQIKEQN